MVEKWKAEREARLARGEKEEEEEEEEEINIYAVTEEEVLWVGVGGLVLTAFCSKPPARLDLGGIGGAVGSLSSLGRDQGQSPALWLGTPLPYLEDGYEDYLAHPREGSRREWL